MEEQSQSAQPAEQPVADPWPLSRPAVRATSDRTGRRLAAGLVGLALVVAGAAAAGSHGLGSALPNAAVGARAATAPSHVVASVDAVQDQAIQQVIQQGNQEQVQAIASHDPSVMADTSTTDHYQQLVQINQDLLEHGVTAIQLLNLEWGAVNVNGSAAMATVFETWSTTYEDGTTEVSRDRNDYTLVQNQGAWKIQADEHPDVQAPSSPRSPGGQSPFPQQPQPPSPVVPTTPGDESTSHNWAGYAATGSNFTAVDGTWTVPHFSADSGFGMDATWVGIGGVRSRDLIQAGTQQVVSGSGTTQYQAWIETLPQAAHPVNLTIHPGDSVSVSIAEQTPNDWLISFTNNTTGQAYQQNVAYASTHSSAEWVEEAPSSGRGAILPLDDFGTVSFTNGSATKDGQSLSIAGTGAQGITMVGSSGQALATASDLTADGAGFSVTRTAAPTATQQLGPGGRGFGSGGRGSNPSGRRGFGG